MRLLVLAILLVSFVTSGCFVADELNQGSKIMDQHSGKKPKAPESDSEASSASGSSFISGFDAGKKLEKIQDKYDEVTAKPPDPNNTMVQCQVEGRVRFTRKYDCQALGGRLVMR